MATGTAAAAAVVAAGRAARRGPRGSSSSSGGGVDDGGIPCGTTSCASPQVCCYGLAGGTCADSCADGSVTVSCTATSCSNGEVCCATYGMGAGATSCTPQAQCSGYQLCSSTTDCPSGQTCMGFGAFAGANLPMFCAAMRDGGYRFDGGFPRDADTTPAEASVSPDATPADAAGD